MVEKKEPPYKFATDKDVEIAKKGQGLFFWLVLFSIGLVLFVITILWNPNPMELVWYFPHVAVLAIVVWGLFKRTKWLPRFILIVFPITLILGSLGTAIALGVENIDWLAFVINIAPSLGFYAVFAWYLNSRPECFPN